MPMLLGLGRENQFENCFLLASISCVFCVLDFSIESLLNWNRGRRRWALRRSGRSQLPGEVGRPASRILAPDGVAFIWASGCIVVDLRKCPPPSRFERERSVAMCLRTAWAADSNRTTTRSLHHSIEGSLSRPDRRRVRTLARRFQGRREWASTELT